ncbi:hypothetical protein [Streptomyces sp. NPDC057616]
MTARAVTHRQHRKGFARSASNRGATGPRSERAPFLPEILKH